MYFCTTRMLYGRSAFWRTKWLQHQKTMIEQQQQTGLRFGIIVCQFNILLLSVFFRPGEKQLPPAKTVVRGNETRWDSNFVEAAKYHLEYFPFVVSFYEKVSFPRLAPVAIAYLLTPKSSAQAERTFSLLGHKDLRS